MELGPGTCIMEPGPGTWLKLDQGWGSSWIMDGDQRGPGTGLNLDLGWGSTWTMDEAQLGPGT